MFTLRIQFFLFPLQIKTIIIVYIVYFGLEVMFGWHSHVWYANSCQLLQSYCNTWCISDFKETAIIKRIPNSNFIVALKIFNTFTIVWRIINSSTYAYKKVDTISNFPQFSLTYNFWPDSIEISHLIGRLSLDLTNRKANYRRIVTIKVIKRDNKQKAY